MLSALFQAHFTKGCVSHICYRCGNRGTDWQNDLPQSKPVAELGKGSECCKFPSLHFSGWIGLEWGWESMGKVRHAQRSRSKVQAIVARSNENGGYSTKGFLRRSPGNNVTWKLSSRLLFFDKLFPVCVTEKDKSLWKPFSRVLLLAL